MGGSGPPMTDEGWVTTECQHQAPKRSKIHGTTVSITRSTSGASRWPKGGLKQCWASGHSMEGLSGAAAAANIGAASVCGKISWSLPALMNRVGAVIFGKSSIWLAWLDRPDQVERHALGG